jgi:hypothetical protein
MFGVDKDILALPVSALWENSNGLRPCWVAEIGHLFNNTNSYKLAHTLRLELGSHVFKIKS